ncbi:Uncharacterised protein [Mycoplasmopsis californica]|uniref:DUF3137 domain-containing protein n=1 Tax=Mycoplasmopsis equigenitalium TaxID=114883 RepID=A0ABY5J1N4_9BACT|nr:hypothetical protein [Mycoplasmopsis equigenitalium]UUD37172.1 hypothetical protein NPA09_01190 [Mycoplasmopsis equigenitalium]VEU69522.1 Uncharacterised protein [Mycoplasmopsis californica]
MKIIEKEKFSEFVDQNLKERIRNDVSKFWDTNTKRKKFFFSIWQWFLYVAIGLVSGLLIATISWFVIQNFDILLLCVFIVSFVLFSGILILIAILKRRSYLHELRKLINERELVKETFCSDPLIEPIVPEDGFEESRDIHELYDFELSKYGIPSDAIVSKSWGHYEFKLGFKFADFIELKIMQYRWEESDGQRTREVYCNVGILQHTINLKNIDQANDINYAMFSNWKTNINLESSEFNKKVKLNVPDEIKARLLFTPVIQAEILDGMKNSLLKRIAVRKFDNVVRVTFAPLNKKHLIIEGKNFNDLESYVKTTVTDLKRDVYSIIELLRYSIYNGNQKKFSYKYQE